MIHSIVTITKLQIEWINFQLSQKCSFFQFISESKIKTKDTKNMQNISFQYFLLPKTLWPQKSDEHGWLRIMFWLLYWKLQFELQSNIHNFMTRKWLILKGSSKCVNVGAVERRLEVVQSKLMRIELNIRGLAIGDCRLAADECRLP